MVSSLDYLLLAAPIEHLDVCKVWKGLSLIDAKSLLEIQRALVSYLESFLAKQLHEMDSDTCSVSQLSILDEHEGHSRRKVSHRLTLRLDDLILKMLSTLRTALCDSIHDRSSGYLMELILLYLASCDYFTDLQPSSSPDIGIVVSLRSREGMPSFTSSPGIAEVARNPDFLSFSQLDVLPREGQELRIVPHYRHATALGEVKEYASIVYSVESQMPWLKWDKDLFGFKGVIPMYSESRSLRPNSSSLVSGAREGPYTVLNQLRIEIKAVLTERHSLSSICLQRTIRARLTIKVIPWYAHKCAHAPTGPSFDSLAFRSLGDVSRGTKQDETSFGVPNDHENNEVLSRTSSLSLDEWTIPLARKTEATLDSETIPLSKTFDSKDYNIQSIFAGHKQFRKPAALDGSPRKHVDTLFGLGAPEDADFAGVQAEDVQVYHLQKYNPNWGQRERRNARQESQSHVEEPAMPTSSTVEQTEPTPTVNMEIMLPTAAEGSTPTHGMQPIYLDNNSWNTPRSSRQGPSHTTSGYTVRTHPQYRADQRSSSMFDEEAESLLAEYLPRHIFGKKDATRWLDLVLSPHSSYRSRYVRGQLLGSLEHEDADDDSEDRWHWQDPAHFGEEFFEQYDACQRRQGLHGASAELFSMVQDLQADISGQVPGLDGIAHEPNDGTDISVVQSVEHEIGDVPPFSLPFAEDEVHNHHPSSDSTSNAESEDEAESVSSPKIKGKGRSSPDQDLPTLPPTPYIICYTNRFSPLRDLRDDTSSIGSDKSIPRCLGNISRTLFPGSSKEGVELGSKSEPQKEDPSNSLAPPEDDHICRCKLDSGYYELDDYASSSGSSEHVTIPQVSEWQGLLSTLPADIAGEIAKLAFDNLPFRLRAPSNSMSPLAAARPHSPYRQDSGSSRASSGSVAADHGNPNEEPYMPRASHRESDSAGIITENANVDPRVRREQAALWQALSARADVKVAQAVEREERKAYFEYLKREMEEEAREKERVLGDLEGFVNGEDEDGDGDDGSVEGSLGASRSGGESDMGFDGDDEMENSMNFGC